MPLIVADWKVTASLAESLASEIPEEVLDPPPPPERNPREVYAPELALRPELLADLSAGGRQADGIERILERAQLTSSERAVLRPALYGIESRLIAEDLGWRLNLVETLLRNARHRLRWLGENADARRPRGNLIRESGKSGRASASDVRRSPRSSARAYARSAAG